MYESKWLLFENGAHKDRVLEFFQNFIPSKNPHRIQNFGKMIIHQFSFIQKKKKTLYFIPFTKKWKKPPFPML